MATIRAKSGKTSKAFKTVRKNKRLANHKAGLHSHS